MLNKLIANVLPHMPKKLVWVFSKRYIAGESIEEGILASKLLNEKGIETTIDLLGEFIKTLGEAEDNKNQYIDIINQCTGHKIQGNFSLKPTMFGLLIDKEVCYNYIREIVVLATQKNTFVRIDMEDSQCVDMELDIFKRLKLEFPANVGLVVQAYLRRTLNDVKVLSELNSKENPLNFRLCKGIYVEPENIAFKEFEQVQQNFLNGLEFMIKSKIYVGIATHDKHLVHESYKLIEKYNVPKSMYEFQMLYGVTPDLRKSIVNKGHLMRVYVPFGKHWFGYSTRRLKENPKIATEIIKALFVRG
ncbi:MAG: proline dehydrogenase family protein [Bacteroidetes bacterium]|nr:proline dehydrogenase family protein [Bacteroidota bacterium]